MENYWDTRYNQTGLELKNPSHNVKLLTSNEMANLHEGECQNLKYMYMKSKQ